LEEQVFAQSNLLHYIRIIINPFFTTKAAVAMKNILYIIFLTCNLPREIKYRKFLLILVSSFYLTGLTFHVTAQQPTQEWIRRYPGLQPSYGANGLSVKLDSSGNVYVLAGVATDTTLGDYGLLKYSSTGTLLWSRYYNSPGNLSDGPVAFAVSPSGDAYITGTSGINFTEHITTVKFNSNGVLQWAKVYNGGGPGDFVNDIEIDNTGNVIIVGGTAINNNLGYGLLIKYNPSGDSLLVRKFSQLSQVNNIEKMCIDDSNNIYTCGYIAPGMYADYLVIKYNSNGNVLWYTTYNGISNNDDIAHFIAVDSSRNVYAVGTNYAPSYGFYNTLLKINTIGTIQWARPYRGLLATPSCQFPKGMVMSHDDNSIFYTTFSSNESSSGFDIVTLKYNSFGDSQWTRRYSGGVVNTSNRPTSLNIDKYSDIYITGRVYYASTGYTGAEIKYFSNGTQQWLINNDRFLSNDIIIKSDMSFYLAASGPDSNNVINAMTIKYNQPDGIQNISNEVPKVFWLGQNYPNPFNPSTKIRFDIKSNVNNEKANVRLTVFDILGREISVLVDQKYQSGTYEAVWDASKLPSGIYFYKLESDSYSETKKAILIK